MSSEPCHKCAKTVYVTEKIEASNFCFHKACFKCCEPGCILTLNLKNFEIVGEGLYCKKHAPKPKATCISDSLNVVHAIQSPKKSNEGLHKIVTGTGEIPQVGLDLLSLQSALNAPKKPSENLLTRKGEILSN
jgi:hypothetical protein